MAPRCTGGVLCYAPTCSNTLVHMWLPRACSQAALPGHSPGAAGGAGRRRERRQQRAQGGGVGEGDGEEEAEGDEKDGDDDDEEEEEDGSFGDEEDGEEDVRAEGSYGHEEDEGAGGEWPPTSTEALAALRWVTGPRRVPVCIATCGTSR